MPPKKISGTNTAISDSEIDRTVKPTSLAPRIAASSRGMPASRCRETFSSTTIASSTTKPVEIVSAISDRLSRLKPARYITPNVPMIEVGTATLGIAAARTLRRKANTTRITRTTATISVFWVSASDCRIVVERSTATVRSTSPGSEAISRGNSAFTASTTSMMLAPGCRETITATPGLPSTRPALRRSSTESTTSATSDSLTGALLR